MDTQAPAPDAMDDPEGLEDPNEALEPTEAVAPDGELTSPSLNPGRPVCRPTISPALRLLPLLTSILLSPFQAR